MNRTTKAASETRGPGRPSTGAQERILKAAHDLLVNEGYSELTTQKVAERAGDNKALIQYYFGSKDGLVEAVGEQLNDRVLEVLERALSNVEGVEMLVEDVVEEMWEFFHGAADLQRVYFDLAAHSIGHEPMRKILRESRDRYKKLLSDRIEAQEEITLSKEERLARITFFVAVFDGLALELVQSGDTPELKGALELFKKTATQLLAGD